MTSVGAGYLLRALQAPGENSAEVGFARDMMDHHGQAVEMALLLYDRTEDETMRVIARDIALTQQGQIGMMMGWLDLWGQTLGGLEPSMAWLGMPTTGLMPGRATAADINRLRELQGVEADILFMKLMIPHHQGGVAMAEAVLERTKRPQVRALAESIAASQTAEIAYMQELLQQKGATPLPEQPPMNHDTMTP
jgi:uncharacterized protein (DUF305 family)